MSREPITAPIRSFFAFSSEFCSPDLEIFTPKEDAVDGADRDDDGNRGPEYGANIPSIGWMAG